MNETDTMTTRLPLATRLRFASQPPPVFMPVPAITIGWRLRRDLGDLEGLRASIDRRGLMHPLLVRSSDGRLVCGWRRLEAVRSLGWETVPVLLVDVTDDEIHDLELVENTERASA